MGLLTNLKGDEAYPVDRLQHSLQAATRAVRDGRDEEYVVCALLHDIGESLGPFNHGEVVAAVLKPFVSEANHWMLEHHPVFQVYFYGRHLGDRPERSASAIAAAPLRPHGRILRALRRDLVRPGLPERADGHLRADGPARARQAVDAAQLTRRPHSRRNAPPLDPLRGPVHYHGRSGRVAASLLGEGQSIDGSGTEGPGGHRRRGEQGTGAGLRRGAGGRRGQGGHVQPDEGRPRERRPGDSRQDRRRGPGARRRPRSPGHHPGPRRRRGRALRAPRHPRQQFRRPAAGPGRERHRGAVGDGRPALAAVLRADVPREACPTSSVRAEGASSISWRAPSISRSPTWRCPARRAWAWWPSPRAWPTRSGATASSSTTCAPARS